jgi:hypothetical protein
LPAACGGVGLGQEASASRRHLKLDSSLTVARVGLFLDQHRQTLMAEERHLAALRAHAPVQPLYLDRKREPGKLIKAWNLVVPERVLSRLWGTVA